MKTYLAYCAMIAAFCLLCLFTRDWSEGARGLVALGSILLATAATIGRIVTR